MTGAVDVLVVGAGLAGLTAADRLVRTGASVAVLEARDRVGGRTVNGVFSDGTTVEMGGQWIGPSQTSALSLAEELGLELYPTYDIGDSVSLIDGQVVRYADDSFGLTAEALGAVEAAAGELDELAESVPLEAPWRAPDADELDGQTLQTWIEGRVADRHARAFCRLVAEGLFAAEPQDISLLHFLFYIHSGGLIERMISTTGGAQELRLAGGSQRLALALAERLAAVVRRRSPVRGLWQDPDGMTAVHDGGRVHARRVVVAIPPALAARIDYRPPVPPLRDQLTQKAPMGYVIKAMVRYDRPFWRDEGLSGAVVSFDGDPASIVFDNTPLGAEGGVLLAFLEGRHGRELGRREQADRQRIVLANLAKYLGPRAAEPLEYMDTDWAAEEWTRGCYGAHLAPGVWTQYGPALSEPCGLIHWAGAETSPIWNGYMDGAIRSGERVAAEVAALLA